MKLGAVKWLRSSINWDTWQDTSVLRAEDEERAAKQRNGHRLRGKTEPVQHWAPATQSTVIETYIYIL